MTVLSRQSIIEYMHREKDPLEIYSIGQNGKRHNVPQSHVNEDTVELSIGTKVGELDNFKLEKELDYVFPLDRKEYIYSGGLNPFKERKAIVKSTRILDLNNLDDYKVEKEGVGDRGCYSYIVRSKDNMFTFSTRITKKKEDDEKASGIILHPEIFYYRMLASSTNDILLTLTDTLDLIENHLSSKKNPKPKQLTSKSNEPEVLKKVQYGLMTVRDKIHFPKNSLPSTKFTIIWTDEYVHVPLDLSAEIGTKSKFARLGCSSHLTSPNVHPGYHGNLALELENAGNHPLTFFIGQPVAELKFFKLDKPISVGYNQNRKSFYKKDQFTL